MRSGTAPWECAGRSTTPPDRSRVRPEEIEKIESALASAFDIRFVFNQWTLGEEFCTECWVFRRRTMTDPWFDLLAHLGFKRRD